MTGDVAEEVTRRLQELADEERAAFVAGYFRTEPGGYGEGDRFLGVPVPETRRIAREHRAAELPDIARLLANPWHEVRFAGVVILVERYRRAPPEQHAELVAFYLHHREGVSSWDLVDASAQHIVGEHLADLGDASPLDELAGSPRLWDRRIAVLASWAFTKRGDPSVTLRLAERLVGDPEDLMHKAVGWMLREVGKRDEAALLRFLDAHADAMPRTALRYAIERLEPPVRARYMEIRRRR